MRICLATTHFAPMPGGISHYYTSLCRLLTDAGHSVILLTISSDDKQSDDHVSEQGSFIKVSLARNYHHYRDHYQAYFRPGGYGAATWIATGMAMRDWLVENAAAYKIDLIETMDYGGTGIFLKQDNLPPLVIDAHSSALQIDRQYPLLRSDQLSVIKELESASFTYADCIITHSPMNLEELKAMGHEQSVFSRAPWLVPEKSINWRSSAPDQYLVISSLQMIKGAEVMIKAAQSAGRSLPALCIYWAGEDSYSAPGGQLTSAYLQKKYPDVWGKQFRWIGHKNADELHSLRSEISAIIIPSLWDTFNYVVPETLHAGIPLIVSDKTGAAYLAPADPQVTRFRAGDAEALAGILIHSSTRTDKKETDQQLACFPGNYFSPENILTERMNIYTAILENKQKPDMDRINSRLLFLDRYTTAWRKTYYTFRKKIKARIRPDINKLSH